MDKQRTSTYVYIANVRSKIKILCFLVNSRDSENNNAKISYRIRKHKQNQKIEN